MDRRSITLRPKMDRIQELQLNFSINDNFSDISSLASDLDDIGFDEVLDKLTPTDSKKSTGSVSQLLVEGNCSPKQMFVENNTDITKDEPEPIEMPEAGSVARSSSRSEAEPIESISDVSTHSSSTEEAQESANMTVHDSIIADSIGQTPIKEDCSTRPEHNDSIVTGNQKTEPSNEPETREVPEFTSEAITEPVQLSSDDAPLSTPEKTPKPVNIPENNSAETDNIKEDVRDTQDRQERIECAEMDKEANELAIKSEVTEPAVKLEASSPLGPISESVSEQPQPCSDSSLQTTPKKSPLPVVVSESDKVTATPVAHTPVKGDGQGKQVRIDSPEIDKQSKIPKTPFRQPRKVIDTPLRRSARLMKKRGQTNYNEDQFDDF